MIDTKELRRLAQAATPGPWINHGRQPNVAGLPHSAVAAKTLLARVYSEAYGDVEQETANASFIAAANPAAVSELLDRLEAAEKAVTEAYQRGYATGQEPVAWLHETRRDSDVVTDAVKHVLGKVAVGSMAAYSIPLYTLPGAQPAPSFADAYQGAMEEVAIWKRRALEAEDLNRKFIAEINGPTHMGEPAQPAPSAPDGVVEALQRLIENGAVLGPASSEDALLVARYRQRLLASAPSVPDVDALAQFIREIDGKHQLGAGVLAERIAEWLAAAREAKPCP